jgi:26S proteasome regulatory subunit N6
VVAWCIAEKRSFLRQRVQSKLAALLFKAEKYTDALQLVSKLIRELKKLEDKQLLVETHLVEARIQHSLRNVPKSKAALTAARTNGNSIYVVPVLQGEIDHMSGTLSCEEGDYNTAYSYFLEAFEGFANVNGTGKQGDPRAGLCLKHMMLCKVLQGAADDVPGIASKWGLKHQNAELSGLSAIAGAAKKRSLEEFDAASVEYSVELQGDVLVSHHLSLLYETMLEANLLKIIEPFSCVEISRIADLINLPEVKVEKKLSQMILDKKLKGILDQGNGTLIVYDKSEVDGTYGHAADVVANMELVVASLFNRAKKIT